MTPLRQQFLNELKRGNYAPRTVQTYLDALIRVSRHFQRSPALLTVDELRAYQLHLIDLGVSWSAFNQVVCALRFLFARVLQRPDVIPFVRFAKKPKTLPVVLSPNEVQRVLTAVANPTHRFLFRLMYGGGLRISEAIALQVGDLDWERRVVWIRAGKGQKDRSVPLPHSIEADLRQHQQATQATSDVFRNRDGQRFNPATLQRAFQWAVRDAGLTKAAHPHTRRHCYATHLLEQGVDVPTLQRLLGHTSASTTLRYLHLRTERLPHLRSPLDQLDGPTDPPAPPRGGCHPHASI